MSWVGNFENLDYIRMRLVTSYFKGICTFLITSSTNYVTIIIQIYKVPRKVSILGLVQNNFRIFTVDRKKIKR